MPTVGMHPEKAFFSAFIVPATRRRYIELLDAKRGREKILDSLHHFKYLDPRFCRKLKPGEQNIAAILRTLKSLGAPTRCSVMSSSSELDGQEMDLSEALKGIIGQDFGAFISCVPGKLAYFESEEPGDRYICYRERPPMQ
jgi:hypothetical protein